MMRRSRRIEDDGVVEDGDDNDGDVIGHCVGDDHGDGDHGNDDNGGGNDHGSDVFELDSAVEMTLHAVECPSTPALDLTEPIRKSRSTRQALCWRLLYMTA